MRQITPAKIYISIIVVGLVLFITGVMQDLLEAAKVRATVAQIQSYNTVVNTFIKEYNFLPGDMPGGKAKKKLGVVGSKGVTADDGCINSNPTCEVPIHFSGEMVLFWRHLSSAYLIDFNPSKENTNKLGQGFPATKLNKGGWISYTISGINYWKTVAGDFDKDSSQPLDTTFNAMMSPSEAFGIDNKLDDGVADLGTVTVALSWDGNDGTTGCHNNGEYDIAMKEDNCSLQIMADF